jgi:hypothetical protein
MKYYAGIGSRETPDNICIMMSQIARKLEQYNYCLRSGGAPGADLAFEQGVLENKEIYIPWKNFNGNIDGIVPPLNAVVAEYVKQYHPNWKNLSNAAKKLMARNTYQILGKNLNDPVDFVLCWTKNGKDAGGTGFAIRMAWDFNIPVYNFKTDIRKINELLLDIGWETKKNIKI